MSAVDAIFAAFAGRGAREYGGERVSQLEHALQSAAMAEAEHRPAVLIAAALLHDIGHLVHDLGDDPAAQGIDDVHEQLGRDYLMGAFGPAVADPVGLHVDAKRYLCGVEPDYFARLSPASVLSLKLQGGPMNRAQADAFMRRPHAADAVAVRRWDEQAKVVGAPTPDLAHYRSVLEACLIPR